MCRIEVLEFFIENVRPEEFRDKRVLEVGSKYVNGSVRPLIERFMRPKEYIGIDIEPGKYVDVVLPAEKLVEYFGRESFDVVISTETLEHVKDWRIVITNMKNVLKPGGYIYITTPSRGFPYHGYPYDFWRYEAEDMRRIFADFEIINLTVDHEALGVFVKARKPEDYKPVDLSSIALYSMVLGRRTKVIPDLKDMPLTRRLMIRLLSSKAKWLLPGALLNLLERRYLT
ncbi:MAG: class I SAM-dependent methyltransferase [Candidatus Bathyarchaeia archaeon]